MFKLVTIFVINLLIRTNANLLDPNDIIVNNKELADEWSRSSEEFDQLVFSPQKTRAIELIDKVIRTTEQNQPQISQQCTKSLNQLKQGLINRRFWAYKFLESSGFSTHAGLTHGYLSSLGNYDQCLSISVNEQNSDGEPFQGQYCFVKIKFPDVNKEYRTENRRNFIQPLKLNITDERFKNTIYEHFANHSELFHYASHTFALCLPSTCSQSEANSIVKELTKTTSLKAEIYEHCQVSESMLEHLAKQPVHQLISLLILISIIGLVCFATAFTYLFGDGTMFAHFSVIRNTQRLCTDYRDPYVQKMRYFDSFKFYYHNGALFAHLIGFIPIIPYTFAVMQDISQDIENQWLLAEYLKRAIYTTQLIFVMSGCLTCYLMLPIFEKSPNKISFISFVFKRWLRTAPTTIAIIITMFALGNFYRGPIAHDLLDQHLNNCRNSWFLTVFNLNNYQVLNQICIPMTWSQSVDFHCWILAYFPLKMLAKNPRKGLIMIFSFIGIGVVLPALVMFYHQLPPVLYGRPMDIVYFGLRGNYFSTMHLGTHNNIAAYFVGILMGYCFSKNIRPQSDLLVLLFTNVCGWITVISIYGPYILANYLGIEFGPILTVLYGGVFRILYQLLFVGAFVLQFYCKDLLRKIMPGYATFVDSKFFVPFGRLAFSVFISQIIPMAFYFTSYEYIPHNRYFMAFRFIPIVLTCWVFGYIVFLLFEGPVISITKSMMFKSDDEQKTAVNNNVNNNVEKVKRT